VRPDYSGGGFTHLDFHSYDDAGSLPAYPTLLRRARVLLGEVGQSTERIDDGLQKAALATYLARAAAEKRARPTARCARGDVGP
jgi:hypothetical protein